MRSMTLLGEIKTNLGVMLATCPYSERYILVLRIGGTHLYRCHTSAEHLYIIHYSGARSYEKDPHEPIFT